MNVHRSFLSRGAFRFRRLFCCGVTFRVGAFVLDVVMAVVASMTNTRRGDFCSFAIGAVSKGSLPLSAFGNGGMLMIGITSGYNFAPRCTGLRRLCRGCKGSSFIIVKFPTGGFLRRRPKAGRRVGRFYALGCKIAFPVVTGVSMGKGSVTPLCR